MILYMRGFAERPAILRASPGVGSQALLAGANAVFAGARFFSLFLSSFTRFLIFCLQTEKNCQKRPKKRLN